MGDIALKRFQLALEGGYTSGTGSVYNGGSPLVALRRLAVEEKVGFDIEPVWEKPLEARGTYAGAYTHILHMLSAKGTLPAFVYADDLCVLGRMVFDGAPTITTLPSSPTALLAAVALSVSGNTLTTQPNATADGALAKILAVTLSNVSTSSTAVSVTITGTDINNNALTEILSFSAGTTTTSAVGGGTGALTVTLYTRNYFKTVNANGITSSAQPSGDEVAVAGVNAFLWVMTPDMGPQQGGSTLQSATGEYYDGTAAWQIPGIVAEKITLTSQIGKSFKLDMSVVAQKKVLLAASTGSVNSGAALGTFNCLQNLSDNVIAAIPTYTTRFYSDVQGVAPGTTQVLARVVDLKMDIEATTKLGKAADGTPYPSFVARGFYGDKTTMEATLLFNSASGGTYDPVDVGNFLNALSRTLRIAYPGIALPCGTLSTNGGWPSALQDANSHGGYYGIMVDMSGKFETMTEKDVDGRMAVDFKLSSEVDLSNMGVPYQVTIISRMNPNQ